MTALDDLADRAFHLAAAPQRARMLSRLADTELFVALAGDPQGDVTRLRLFPLEAGQVALACDTEDRLADFLGAAVIHAAMPGRVLAALLGREGVGLLVNPGLPSEMLLDAAMLDWLGQALSDALSIDAQPAPAGLVLTAPDPAVAGALGAALAMRLADLRGQITGAALVGVAATAPDHGAAPTAGHLLLIAGAAPDRQPAIARAMAQMLAFLPPQPGGVDLSFAERAAPGGALLFDLTPPPAPDPEPAPPPRPTGPPILR